MEVTCEALGLSALMPRRGGLEGWLGLPALSKGGCPTSPTDHLGQVPFKWTRSGGKGPGACGQVSWGVCWAPSKEEATRQSVCQTLDLAA